MAEIAQKLAQNFSGPVIFHYVWWILQEAKRRGIKRLYFLARDGYTLRRVAEMFCTRFNLEIECRYLYCSRAALRMPTYFFIGEEAFDLLFLWGYRVTLKSLLQRGELTEEERKAVYQECGMLNPDEESVLSRRDFDQYVDQIKRSHTFRTCVLKRSRSAYTDTIGYLKMEGLTEQRCIAVVDSGWTGSMQRSLRQLLEFSGFTVNLIGFYFGMYALSSFPADGEYLTWFFNAQSNKTGKIQFCNNLFECLLAAPHGMTVSYQKMEDGYAPVLLPAPIGQELQRTIEQSDAICKYAAERLEQIVFTDFDASALRRDTVHRISRYMFRPTREEVTWYGQSLFCDDVTEAYRLQLAGKGQERLLENYSFVRRVLRRLGKRSVRKNTQAELLWPFEVISFLPPGKRWWYRWNVYLWEWMKYTRQQKGRKTGRKPLEAQQMIEHFDVVSFDIFDTLLYRVLNSPVDVFRLMGPEVEERFGISDFAEKRIAAEREARRRTPLEEVTADEIYAVLLPDCATAAALLRLEKETEQRVLRRDSVMSELMKHCIAKGKKVLILSDMYQSKDFLQDVLEQCGIDGYHAVYVSSEEKATKASGSLFLRVAEREQITDRKRWLHIGDNVHSDYDVPKSLGLSVKLYDNGRIPQLTETFFRRKFRWLKTQCRAYCQKGKLND